MSSNSATYIYPNQETNLDWGEVQIPIGKPVSSISGYLLEKNDDHEMGYIGSVRRESGNVMLQKMNFAILLKASVNILPKAAKLLK